MYKLWYTIKEVSLMTIDNVVLLVDTLLKSNEYETAQKLINVELNKISQQIDKLYELKQIVEQHETDLH
tara:strand:+ start:270 stop:476 length:207 start_codon:yes stop_codon:yes gene_type:complete